MSVMRSAPGAFRLVGGDCFGGFSLADKLTLVEGVPFARCWRSNSRNITGEERGAPRHVGWMSEVSASAIRMAFALGVSDSPSLSRMPRASVQEERAFARSPLPRRALPRP